VVQQEIALCGAVDRHVDRLDVGEDRRVRRAGVLEVQRPLDRGEIVVRYAHAPHEEARLRVGPRECVLGALVVEFAGVLLGVPRLQQFCRRAAAVREREGRLGGELAAGAFADRQVAQPHGAAVGQDGPRIGPVGLVAGDAVAGVADLQHELRCAVEIRRHGRAGHPLAQHGAAEPLLACGRDGEDDAALAGARLVVAVNAHDGGEGLGRPRQPHYDLARGVAVKAARELGIGDFHGLAVASVLRDTVVIGHNGEARRRGAGFRRALEPRRRPAAGLGHFIGRYGRGLGKLWHR
jgi:hypothetical protein